MQQSHNCVCNVQGSVSTTNATNDTNARHNAVGKLIPVLMLTRIGVATSANRGSTHNRRESYALPIMQGSDSLRGQTKAVAVISVPSPQTVRRVGHNCGHVQLTELGAWLLLACRSPRQSCPRLPKCYNVATAARGTSDLSRRQICDHATAAGAMTAQVTRQGEHVNRNTCGGGTKR